MYFSIALEEILVHILHNAFTDNMEQMLEISVEKNLSRVQISIYDKGIPGKTEFKPCSYDIMNQDDICSGKNLSIHLINSFVDRISIKNHGTGGRETKLIKYFAKAQIYEKKEETISPKIQQISFSYRLIKEEEAINVAQCVYDEYGYSYPYEDIYYPEYFVQNMKNGTLYPFIAVGEQGEIGGHLALSLCELKPALAEVSMGVVKKDFRRLSLTKNLIKTLVEFGKTLSINGLYVRPVTYHTHMQHIVLAAGFQPCGFSLSYIPERLETSYASDKERRLDLCIAYLSYDDNYKPVVFLPEEQKKCLLSIYSDCGITPLVGTPASPIIEETDLIIDLSLKTKSATIKIIKSGKDSFQQLKEEVYLLKLQKVEMIELMIPLCDQSAPFLYDVAKECGFFFTGLLPHTAEGDFLLMQNLMGNAVNYQLIRTEGCFYDLLEHIKRFDPSYIV